MVDLQSAEETQLDDGGLTLTECGELRDSTVESREVHRLAVGGRDRAVQGDGVEKVLSLSTAARSP